MQDENNAFNFIETFSPIHGITGITIGNGTPNTQTNPEEIVTPLGHTLYPVKWANTTYSGSNYIVFVHEIKRAISLDQVAWPSVMNGIPTVYTQEDKNIGMFERTYWNSVYQDSMTYIDLNKIVEDLSSKVQKENSLDDKNENTFLKTNNHHTDSTLLHNQSFNSNQGCHPFPLVRACFPLIETRHQPAVSLRCSFVLMFNYSIVLFF